MIFKVTRWSSPFALSAMEHHVKTRKDAFADCFLSEVYDMIAGEGLLDTLGGHKCMAEAEAIVKAYLKPLPKGTYRLDRLQLRPGPEGAHGSFIDISQRREYRDKSRP